MGNRAQETPAYLFDGATARVGNREYHLAWRYLALTLVAPIPARDDEVPGREAQGLQVGPAHAGLHVVHQTKEV